MPWVPDRKALGRSLLCVLDGIALWFLAILAAAYAAENELPWATVNAFLTSATYHTQYWLFSPGLTGFELIVYAGFFLIGFGPLWYLVAKPLSRKFTRQVSTLDPEETSDASVFETIASEFNRRRP